jgi:hypothetical protein
LGILVLIPSCNLQQEEELQRGKHLAGYGGYLSLNESSAANDIGLPRPTEKDQMLLYDLDQYSRDLWGGKDVGYGGFKPHVQFFFPHFFGLAFHKSKQQRSNNSIDGCWSLSCSRLQKMFLARLQKLI